MAAVAAGGLVGKGRDISLAALQRHDPYINRIVDVASQVALYTFGHRANEWVRADATGQCSQGEGGDGVVRLGAPEPSDGEETLTPWRWMEVDGGESRPEAEVVATGPVGRGFWGRGRPL